MTSPKRGIPPLYFFFAAVACLGVAGAILETTLSPYLRDIFSFEADDRGKLEFPRELPGFLTALSAGMLLFLPEARVAIVASLALGAGLLGLAQVHIGYGHMIAWLFIWSCGAHLMMPLETALAIQLSEEGRSGTRLGQVQFVATFGLLIGAFLVWQVFGRFEGQYRISFLTAGIAALIAAVIFVKMPATQARPRARTRFVLKKRYSLFYLLCVLFGARKQVFITFGPWVLVKVFEQPMTVLGKLWFVAGVLGLAFKPLLGWMIDRLGERFVLVVDGLVLMVVCIGYGFAESWLSRETALYVLYACFVVDNLMFSVGMARHTYVSKIAEDPGDITPTFSTGITINHAVSMTVPWLGGILWIASGYSAVFVAAAVVAFLTTITALFVRVPKVKEIEPEARA